MGMGHLVHSTWPTFMSRLCKFSTIIHYSCINMHLMLYEVYTFKCSLRDMVPITSSTHYIFICKELLVGIVIKHY